MAGFLRHCDCILAAATETPYRQGSSPSAGGPAEKGEIDAWLTARLVHHHLHGAPIAAFLLLGRLATRGASRLGHGLRNIGLGAVVHPVQPATHCLRRQIGRASCRESWCVMAVTGDF